MAKLGPSRRSEAFRCRAIADFLALEALFTGATPESNKPLFSRKRSFVRLLDTMPGSAFEEQRLPLTWQMPQWVSAGLSEVPNETFLIR